MDADFLRQQEQAEAAIATTRESLATTCAVQATIAGWRSLRHLDIPAGRVTDVEASRREAEIILRLVEAWLDLSRG